MKRSGCNRILLSCVLMFLAVALGCSAETPESSAAPETVHGVSLLTVHPTKVPQYTEAVGTVRALETTKIASQVMGTVISVNVHEGSRVSQGNVLAVIDNAQAEAGTQRAKAMLEAASKDLAAAESQLLLARTTLQRYEQLMERKSVSPQEFSEVKARSESAEAQRDAAQASRAAAEAALVQARVSLEHTQIRAPFSGVVTARLADPGTLAAPGVPLLTLESLSRYRLEVTVNESQMDTVRLGSGCSVVIDALDKGFFQGRVAQLVPAADPASRTVLVKIDLPSGLNLRSGLFGRARFPRGEREALVVPESALIERGQLRGVYVVGADQIANLRFVTLGEASENGFEVLTGLDAGERVVANAAGRDLVGLKVEVR